MSPSKVAGDGWDELCRHLRNIHHRYMELARFHSERCNFPGAHCKRPWGREYTEDDRKLMWKYIEYTEPLCCKLMKGLAGVEYRIRELGIESLKRHGGLVKRSVAHSEITKWHLNKPVLVYLTLLDTEMRVTWRELDETSLRSQQKEFMQFVDGAHGARDTRVGVFDIDVDYKRLWLEIPLVEPVSRMLGQRDRAPVALFRNLGWLLSDDRRGSLKHSASNPGQIALRLFDWIALAKYAIEVLNLSPNKPLVFKLAVRQATKTVMSISPTVEMWPVGTAAEVIRGLYKWFGITLGRTEGVLVRGYAVLKALREAAFKRNGRVYVVDDAGAWIAFSNAVGTLVLGDGNMYRTELRIAAKTTPKKTFKGETSLASELAEAVKGILAGPFIRLRPWHMRLLLPIAPSPAFGKALNLYTSLARNPVAALVELGNAKYLLYRYDNRFGVKGVTAVELYETLKKLDIEVKLRGNAVKFTPKQLEELAQRGVSVRFLDEIEKVAAREMIRRLEKAKKRAGRAMKPQLDVESVRRVLVEMAKIARIIVAQYKRGEYIRIIPHDKTKACEIKAMLLSVGIRSSLLRHKGEVRVYEKRSLEIIKTALLSIKAEAPAGI